MIKREDGFTLIELLITMITFVIVIASVSSIFLGLVNQFKQQSKIAETNLEGLTGLEILRQDIEHAGYGLPSVIPATVAYSEAVAGYNDCAGTAPCNPPRATLSGNGLGGFNGSDDYLVIKAVNIARNDASQRWTTLKNASPYVRTWTPSGENLSASDYVIVLSPDATDMTLVLNGSDSSDFSTTYSSATSSDWRPTDVTETRLVYGVDPSTNLRMPFNRADYFITTVDSDGNNITPQRCASNTGVLVKAVVSHNDGNFDDFMPLLDCVADMQVVYGMDTDATPDGVINCYVNNLADVLATVDAANIRQRVREVRVYILTHEGQLDQNFNRPAASSSIRIGEASSDLPSGSCTGVSVLGRDFDLSGITNWQNYRWKVYTIVVNPSNLGST